MNGFATIPLSVDTSGKRIKIYLLTTVNILLILVLAFIGKHKAEQSANKLPILFSSTLSQVGCLENSPDRPASALEVPTAISLIDFTATVNDDGSVTVYWETGVELNHAGFYLYRSSETSENGERLNVDLIPAQGGYVGATYSFTDSAPVANENLYYTLEEVDIDGNALRHGPVLVCLQCQP